MGMPCAFLLTKLSDLPLYYFLFFFFFHMYNYVVIDSGHREASGYCWRIRSERCLKIYCKLKWVLMVTSTFELCCRH